MTKPTDLFHGFEIDLAESQPVRLHELPRPLAFVLSGGASAAALQVGMIEALNEAGVYPDIVVGTSAGAINGCIVAGHPDDATGRLREIWPEITRTNLLPGNPAHRLATLMRSRQYLYETDGLEALIDRHKPAALIEDLALPFGVTGTDARTGEGVLLTNGDLQTALLASAAIPAIFPRVHVDGRWLMDGGIAANVPISQAIALGAESIVVLDAGIDPHKSMLPRNFAETVQHVVSLMVRHQKGSTYAAAQGRPVLTIPLIDRDEVSPFDFRHTQEFMDLGYRHTADFLDTLGVRQPVPIGSAMWGVGARAN